MALRPRSWLAERTTAIKYKEILDKLIGPERSEVVITVNNSDPQERKQKYRRTREEENAIKEAFNDPRTPWNSSSSAISS